MISVDEIIKKSQFPTIDFKFHNSSNISSYLHKFQISVKSIELDNSPEFNFNISLNEKKYKDEKHGKLKVSLIRSEKSARDLIFYLKNDGWGDEQTCTVELQDERLESLFPSVQLKKNIVLNKDNQYEIFRLSSLDLNSDKFIQYLKNESKKSYSIRFGSPNFDQSNKILLNLPKISISYFSEKEKRNITITKTSDTKLLAGNMGGQLYLSEEGFFWEPSFGNFCIMNPSAVYYANLELSPQKYIKTYKISHKVEKGEIERLKIVVGAKRSCKIKLSFIFVLENNQTIESNDFIVEIWNPRSYKVPYHYRDGLDIKNELEKYIDLMMQDDSKPRNILSLGNQ